MSERTFTLFWKDGKKEEVKGDTIASAFNNAGYGRGAMAALDFFKDGETTEEWVWDPAVKDWVSKGTEVTITFPITVVGRFYADHWPQHKGKQRLGQAFHQFMKLEKVKHAEKDRTHPERIWLDRLYQADGQVAVNMIAERTDYNN